MVHNTNPQPLSFTEYKDSAPTEYTVSQLSAFIKKAVEDNLGFVRVKGEVSGLKIAPSGHVYFNLKDNNAVLAAVCWKNSYNSLKYKPEEGLEVICSGSITTYAGQSKYQMIVQNINPAGIGALMALLEKRKQQFQKEGLFDKSHKKPLPFFPQTIGVITSPTGAVIQDILHRISDRFPTRVLLWPVLVQGSDSAQQITQAIYGFNNIGENSNIPKPDVIIVARGGGSIEDLWSFNEEIVVRAAFNSQIPIISAVGHETDTTLIDHVADIRAPTPTAAAELAVPVKRELAFNLAELEKRMQYAIKRIMDNYKETLESFKHLLPNLQSSIDFQTQRLDEINIRMVNSFSLYQNNMLNQLDSITAKITSPKSYLQMISSNLEFKFIELNRSVNQLIIAKQHELELAIKLLHSYDYKNTLRRGFAIIRNKENNIIKSSKTEAKQDVSIEFCDGTRQGIIN